MLKVALLCLILFPHTFPLGPLEEVIFNGVKDAAVN